MRLAGEHVAEAEVLFCIMVQWIRLAADGAIKRRLVGKLSSVKHLVDARETEVMIAGDLVRSALAAWLIFLVADAALCGVLVRVSCCCFYHRDPSNFLE